MKISDKFSAYFSAVTLNPMLSTQYGLEKHIKENSQRFSYGDVTYSTYVGKYEPKGYELRKIVAIPAALFAGVVKSVYHLAKAFFLACRGESIHANANAYRVARDMEEALGWLITLFNDKKGSYLVQESLFQKACYSHFEKAQEKTVFFSCWEINGVEIPHYYEAERITLLEFRKMDLDSRQEAIKKFQLQDNIDALGQEKFFQKLQTANEKVLKTVNLVDLKMDVATSKLKYALLTDEEFQKVKVSEFSGASEDQISIVSQRIGNVAVYSPRNDPTVDVLNFPIAYFYRIHGQVISREIEKIPECVMALVTDAQIAELNLTKASKSQIDSLFCYIDGKEEVRRFALLSKDQVQPILGKLDAYRLKLISDNQLKNLDLKDMNAESLAQLFAYIDRKEDKRRFALLSIGRVQPILGKLNPYLLTLISDNQLKELDLKDMNADSLKELFCYIDGKEEKRRFALLSKHKLQPILGKLDSYLLKLISNDQLQAGLDLSDLSPEKIGLMFPAFSKESIRLEYKSNIFGSSTTYENGNRTTVIQEGLPESEIDRLSKERKKANTAKLSVLSPDQRASIRAKLSQENLELMESLNP